METIPTPLLHFYGWSLFFPPSPLSHESVERNYRSLACLHTSFPPPSQPLVEGGVCSTEANRGSNVRLPYSTVQQLQNTMRWKTFLPGDGSDILLKMITRSFQMNTVDWHLNQLKKINKNLNESIGKDILVDPACCAWYNNYSKQYWLFPVWKRSGGVIFKWKLFTSTFTYRYLILLFIQNISPFLIG